MFPWYEGRSPIQDYDDDDSGGSIVPPSPLELIKTIGLIFLTPFIFLGFPLILIGLLLAMFISNLANDLKSNPQSYLRLFAYTCILLTIYGICVFFASRLSDHDYIVVPAEAVVEHIPSNRPVVEAPIVCKKVQKTKDTIEILVDDFVPGAYRYQKEYFYNRLDGNRGGINEAILKWGQGRVNMAIAQQQSWGGVWMSMNHPNQENDAINFSRVLPYQIRDRYQARITGVSFMIENGTPGAEFRLELKQGSQIAWMHTVELTGSRQEIECGLHALPDISQLVWVLDHGSPGDSVTLSRISLYAEAPHEDPALTAFVWSYAMLLENWNPTTGLVRDKARDGSGEMDAVQATGSLAAATAVAAQLEIISTFEAQKIVEKISKTLLEKVPRYHGLWPHWVTVNSNDEISILSGTEWSSVDTVIAAVALLEAQSSLGMETIETEQMLREIDWYSLLLEKGISHGFDSKRNLLPTAWDSFGGESWLVDLVYAAATGQNAPLAYPQPPTANGSGFIDELVWLLISPPARPDIWGIDWTAYRLKAAANQVTHFSKHSPQTCFAKNGLFGLSAAEVPDSTRVMAGDLYQPYGIGGQFAPILDGTDLYGSPVVAPHYAAMVASLRPQESVGMWSWLMKSGYFSPLTNVESLMYYQNSTCSDSDIRANTLKGSWNLALQTLGLGNYLAIRNGEIPTLWASSLQNEFIQSGYQMMVPKKIIKPEQPAEIVERECEQPDLWSVGRIIQRANASDGLVHGQFGADQKDPWPQQSGQVQYSGVNIAPSDTIYLKLRYSKHSWSETPIEIYLNDEPDPRAKFIPVDQGSWDAFTWSDVIPLGSAVDGVQTITFATDGQQYGVADLDRFVLSTDEEPETKGTDDMKDIHDQQPNVLICDGKHPAKTSAVGTYVYRQVRDGETEDTIVVHHARQGMQLSYDECPGVKYHRFGAVCSGWGPISVSQPAREMVEDIVTPWGIVEAVRYDSELPYHFLTGGMDDIAGKYSASEWYICGYGLARARYEDRGNKNRNPYISSATWDLISFTPEQLK
jgi:hypothetical protein